MPYIDQNVRIKLNTILDNLFSEARSTGSLKGNLNYCITRLIHSFIQTYFYSDQSGVARSGLCYDALNDAAGILDSVKDELKNAVTNPYEDGKRHKNGPVSTIDDDSSKKS
jgi:hypothetical protein